MTIQAGEDISLELLELKHCGALLELVNANRQHLREWLPWVDNMQTEEHFRQFVLASRERWSEGTELPMMIWWDNALAGRIGIYNIDRYNKTGSIGYWLGRNNAGKGIITRACKAIIDYGFDELQLNRLEIRCGTKNVMSQAVAKRLNFEKEGVVKAGEYLNGDFIDLCMFSMLKSDWLRTSATKYGASQ